MLDLLQPPPTGEDLRKARRAAHLTQTAAADLVGYSRRGWQTAEANAAPSLHAATWALFLLATDGHPHFRLQALESPISAPSKNPYFDLYG